jgi:glucokinase
MSPAPPVIWGHHPRAGEDARHPEPLVVGIDLGGTKTAVALVDADGSVLDRVSTATPAQDGPEAVLATAARLTEGLVAGAPQPVLAVGVGSAGVIDPRTGVVLSATDALPGWTGTRVADLLAGRLRLPVTVDNDVHAHAVGEAWLGAGAGRSSVLVAAAGTGIGGAFVQDGVPLVGSHCAAGHLGHIAVPEALGVECPCGRSGHVEAVASGPALHRLYLRLGGDGSVADARQVVSRAVTGTDALAVQAVRTSATALGRVLGGLANVLDPDVVVVGGGLAGAGTLWWDALREGVRGETIPLLAELAVVPAVLGADAALIGAARRALSELAGSSA